MFPNKFVFCGVTLALMMIDKRTAQLVDEELFSSGYGLEQLMELAGLSVAQCVQDYHPIPCSILVVCGPGNNGGDGLVAARHLFHFGFKISILYPRVGRLELFECLVGQCKGLGIEFVREWVETDLVLDAVFGFSFQGPIREPYAKLIAQMRNSQHVISVDVPSGWDVDNGPSGSDIRPAVLVNLTAPKLCAKYHKGKHYLAGRFIPPNIAKKYSLHLPPYPDGAQFRTLESIDGEENS
jgi:NAD(P)H-hydrate epimerase